MHSRLALLILGLAMGVLAFGATPPSGYAGGAPVLVNTTAYNENYDDGFCTLREAIFATNYNYDYNSDCNDPDGSYDEIRFQLTPPATIQIGTDSLPVLEQTVTIDGSLGPGMRVQIKGTGDPSFPDVFIVGTLGFNWAEFSVIRNFVITDAYTAVKVMDDDVTIAGNYLGTDVTGTATNGATRGVDIRGASRTRIGGTNGLTPGGPCTGDCNLLSGNSQAAVFIDGSDTLIQGNFIGTNPAGTAATRNFTGVLVRDGGGTVVGGPAANAGNLISGNSRDGVSVEAYGGATIQRNLIGTNAAGTGVVPNGIGVRTDDAGPVRIGGPGLGNVISGNSFQNILLSRSDPAIIEANIIGPASDGTTGLTNPGDGILLQQISYDNFIGGGAEGAGNIIAFNTGDGIRIDGSTSMRNNIFANSIYANSGKGIENVNGGNTELAPPVITGAVSGTACTGCFVVVYSDSADEGRVFHGAATAPSGTWSFSGAVTGPNITATAIDPTGNTSEFSAPFTLPATPTPSPSPTTSPTPTPTVTPTLTTTPTPASDPTPPHSPTPTPIPSPSPTLTPPATPTTSPSGTPSPTATATASPSVGPQLRWGDSDCDGVISSRDNQALLREVLQQNALSQTEPCPDLGETVDGRVWGDWDCDGAISSRDNQALLRAVLEQNALPQTEPCPDIGSPV